MASMLSVIDGPFRQAHSSACRTTYTVRRTVPSTAGRATTDDGAAAVILVLLTPALLALAGLVFDGGRAIAARQRAADLAEQAARAGAGTLNVSELRATGADSISPAAAPAAACRYVITVEPGDGCTVTVTPTQVSVTVTTHTPTVLLGLAGIDTFTTTGTATAQAVTGITTVQGTG